MARFPPAAPPALGRGAGLPAMISDPAGPICRKSSSWVHRYAVAETNVAPLRAQADAVFQRTSPYAGVGFLHHCKRLHTFASMLLEQQHLRFDDDVAYAIAMWHDLGLVSERDEGHNYLQRSRALFHRESRGFDLSGVDAHVIDECLLFNHRLLPVPNLCAEAECFRKAVIIEHTRGWVRFGLDATEVRRTFEQYPRDNFDRVLLDFTWRTVKREPLSLVSGVFFGHAAGASV